MIDPHLMALARAVEDGAECPPLSMTLTSGDLVTGVPRSSHLFVDQTYTAVYNRHFVALGSKLKPEQRQEAASTTANETIKSFNVKIDLAGNESITLENARVLWSGRSGGAQIPAIRVSLHAIAAWWVAGGYEIKGDASSFFAIGVGF